MSAPFPERTSSLDPAVHLRAMALLLNANPAFVVTNVAFTYVAGTSQNYAQGWQTLTITRIGNHLVFQGLMQAIVAWGNGTILTITSAAHRPATTHIFNGVTGGNPSGVPRFDLQPSGNLVNAGNVSIPGGMWVAISASCRLN